MQTGEDIQGLRKIIDLTRYISIAILAIHFYISCYAAFYQWGWTADITNRIILNISKTGLFSNIMKPKIAALLLLAISLVGAKGRKEEKVSWGNIMPLISLGLLLFFASILYFYVSLPEEAVVLCYILTTVTGYLLMLSGGARLSRILKVGQQEDIFNTENETFPQEERLLENEFSINLPAKYRLKKQVRDSWINIINPFRGILVAGTPGAGKSYFVIRHIIDQHIRKGFSMFLYDFKYDDLSKIAYNKLLKYYRNYKVKPSFYVINFDDLNHTHRCNPLDPKAMDDITDATEASRTIMLGLNRDWIKKQGDFFVESPINFLTAIIWYLRKYQDGKYCTLPHVIELMQVEYEKLFHVLGQEEEIKVLINPFVSAFQNKAKEQLEGQIASAKIGLARLSSPQLYYVLSGNDFTMDVNNPEEPKIVCMGNNPQKLQVYGAVLSLYISRMIKLVNRKNQLKCSLIFDEFPTIYFNNIDSLIATARSNKVATTLAVQDFNQLKKDYGSEQADVITGIVGNIISGQVTGDTARKLSEMLGKILQDKSSTSINSSDTSLTKSTQLDYAVPAAKIASLSSGEFVGTIADNPEEKISLKAFHCEIQNDHQTIAADEILYKHIPIIKKVSTVDVQENYQWIKREIFELVQKQTEGVENIRSAQSP
ncbi:type IV secretory system conjugative DNA transfer VirD4/TraG family protein [Arcticibacter tournemirensis]|uniref:Type IV secretion system DNA-binding domain-containing protein n=1 Tax=Arcticibacter tournemirensis TaxID=699437 RepID=A0A5M9GWV2_9SPHI|nr:conjugal transfer protein MobC [Arcticibacter tournemirensis]KAA8478261.1 type IV secretion system DNA-binding domain-containing protein [Arcticibacter tournemirensis]TQM50711.1 type IV secretory system conjugative DNA transfer VirD4/TraG family protein [Arcticibacter tournemirensis]